MTMRGKTRYLLIVLLVSAVAAFLYGKIDWRAEEYRDTDLKYYQKIADAAPGIDKDIPRPFSRRILGPYLAGLIPLERDASFFALNFLFSLTLALLLYLFMIELGLSPPAAALSSILFVLNKHLFGSSVWNYFQIKDTLSLNMVLLIFISMRRSALKTMAVFLFIGALTSELPMMTIPVIFVYALEKKWRRGKLKGAMAAVMPAVAAFIILRYIIPAVGGNNLLESFLFYSKKIRYPMVWYGLFINPFIPVSFLPAIHSSASAGFFSGRRYAAWYLAFVVIAALFGSNNERLMAPASIIYFPLIGEIIERRVIGKRFLTGALLFTAVLSSLHHEIARFPLPSRYYTIALSGGSLFALTLIFFVARFREGRGRD